LSTYCSKGDTNNQHIQPTLGEGGSGGPPSPTRLSLPAPSSGEEALLSSMTTVSVRAAAPLSRPCAWWRYVERMALRPSVRYTSDKNIAAGRSNVQPKFQSPQRWVLAYGAFQGSKLLLGGGPQVMRVNLGGEVLYRHTQPLPNVISFWVMRPAIALSLLPISRCALMLHRLV
jgi:hypothetical protein